MDTHTALALRIKALASEKGKSLNRLADFAGISRSHLSRILNQGQSPTVATLEKIAHALEVGIGDLFR